jgi:SAM-dependent methyltransferase
MRKFKIFFRNFAFSVAQVLHRSLTRSRAKELSEFIFVIDDHYGGTRGSSIGRAYIDNYVAGFATREKRSELRILEVGDNQYSAKFFMGCEGYVLEFIPYSALVVDSTNHRLVGDLTVFSNLENYFDIIISTCTLAFTKNPFNAVKTYERILRPGGTLVGVEPFLMQVSEWDYKEYGEYFRFTDLGLRQLISSSFEGSPSINVCALGNRKTTLAQLHGLVLEDGNWNLVNHETKYATLFGYSVTKRI